MSKIRHTLQLLHSGNLNTRQISAALGISKSTVSDIASYTRAAGLDWSEAQHLSDEQLQARLYRSPVARQSRQLEPDYAHLRSAASLCNCAGRSTSGSTRVRPTSTALSARSTSSGPGA